MMLPAIKYIAFRTMSQSLMDLQMNNAIKSSTINIQKNVCPSSQPKGEMSISVSFSMFKSLKNTSLMTTLDLGVTHLTFASSHFPVTDFEK